MNQEKAVAFITNAGNEIERARLDYLLTGNPPARDVINQLFAGQRADSGWAPFWADDYSSIDATCFRLAQAEQLGLNDTELSVKQALDFLARRQAADGSWQEDEAVAAMAPPWATPGNPAATLYLTANCGFWLALWSDGEKQVLQAADYLQTHLHADGHLPGFLHTHWLAAGVWRQLNREEAVQRVLEYLLDRLPDFAASNLAWLITTLYAAGVPAHHPLMDNAASLLERAQENDGRWASEDGTWQDVHTTLEALRALQICARQNM